MKKTLHLLILSFIILLPCMSQENILSIDFAKKGARISPTMYGVFFEEINHAGDGGLYAELIQNRGFEDKVIPATCKFENGFLVPLAKPNYLSGKVENFKLPWDTINKWPGWTLKPRGLSRASIKLTTKDSLNPATPHSAEINITRAKPQEPVELINRGFWGIPIKKDESYVLRFYAKADNNYAGSIIAKLKDEDDVLLAKQEFRIAQKGVWTEYSATLTAKKNNSNALFILSFNTIGKVWIDYVSLFPVKTYKGRKNGLREDVASMIGELKPAFMRWPGGCIVEGFTLENRVKWKETLGDPAKRPGAFSLWGYKNSYGFGYHEFLQFCEDIGAAGMFVSNAGFSCAFRNGDYVPDEELGPYIQEALDAIEYALGDTSSVWGKARAANGHPSPFPLKYIEIGNENYGPLYAKRFNIFYKAIKEKYPQIYVISSLQFDPELQLLEKTDFIDPHYYAQPGWFYKNTNLFDLKQPRPDFKVYVGEYACNQGVGSGNMNAALSEAAFMIGMERNSDLVTMASYAPLIENSNARNWPVNMIWLNKNKVFGRSSYYVQKLFAAHRPDINLDTHLKATGADLPQQTYSGSVGLGTFKTQVVFRDFSVKHNEGTYKADFINNQNDWEPTSGHWRTEDDTYIQGDIDPQRSSFLRNMTFDNYTIEVKAKKNKGSEGFLILFGAADYKNYYQFNIGGHGNTVVVAEKVEGGSNGVVVSDSIPFHIDENRWYNLKVIVKGNEAECFIDDKPILKYQINEMVKRFAIAGFDEKKNEIVIKIVNAENSSFKTNIKIANAGILESTGELFTLSADSKNDENTFKKPDKIIPQVSKIKNVSSDFSIEVKPNSLSILRIIKK